MRQAISRFWEVAATLRHGRGHLNALAAISGAREMAPMALRGRDSTSPLRSGEFGSKIGSNVQLLQLQRCPQDAPDCLRSGHSVLSPSVVACGFDPSKVS
jgi:hypothetical protein